VPFELHALSGLSDGTQSLVK